MDVKLDDIWPWTYNGGRRIVGLLYRHKGDCSSSFVRKYPVCGLAAWRHRRLYQWLTSAILLRIFCNTDTHTHTHVCVCVCRKTVSYLQRTAGVHRSQRLDVPSCDFAFPVADTRLLTHTHTHTHCGTKLCCRSTRSALNFLKTKRNLL